MGGKGGMQPLGKQTEAGWENSLQGVKMSEGSQPGERWCVTLVGTVGSGSETVASTCCHFLQQPQETHTWDARWVCCLLCSLCGGEGGGGQGGNEVLATSKVVTLTPDQNFLPGFIQH